MREIKFRAWNKPTKHMFYWGFFTDIFDKGANDRRNFEPEHNEWMQYTGLKDKNGVEIYESDLLKSEKGIIYEVYWNDIKTGFGLKYKNVWGETLNKNGKPMPYYYESIDWGMKHNLVVVGNKYEGLQDKDK